jgi:ribonuclease HII
MPRKTSDPQNPPPKPKTPKISKAEQRRLQRLLVFESEARQKGYTLVAGIDEAGRGPLAGPVVAAACVIPDGILIPGINDSKQLTPQKRYALFEHITSDARISYGVGMVHAKEIDRINILQATIQAMLQAVAKLLVAPHYLLVDGLKLPHPSIPSQKIVQGDAKSYCIAAASIIAKELRDRHMQEEHLKWPEYGFDRHKGYGTPEHLEALAKHGPCPIHRHSFAPIRKDPPDTQLDLFESLS